MPVEDNKIVSYDMVHRYVRDNGHVLTVIQVNHMVKKIYFYVWCWIQWFFVTNAPCMNEVTITDLLVA
jgi:hypothetical protein